MNGLKARPHKRSAMLSMLSINIDDPIAPEMLHDFVSERLKAELVSEGGVHGCRHLWVDCPECLSTEHIGFEGGSVSVEHMLVEV